MAKTGVVYSPRFLDHYTGTLEKHKRLQTIWSVLEEYKMVPYLTMIEPYPAPEEIVQLVHTPEYIRDLASFTASGGGKWADETNVSRDSYEVALLAAGGCLAAVDALFSGRVANFAALVRPPGHHASRNRGGGFCLLNNVAIAAKYAQQKYGLQRVMIIDWDVHHGNGVQSIFYDDPSVLYFSTHQSGIYPRTGWANETGEGRGEGFTINVPLPNKTGDAAYYYVFNRLLAPVARQYQPELILLAAGFDAHFYDPLGSQEVTTNGYLRLTTMLKGLADEVCGGRIGAVLEGGYDLGTIGYSVAAMISALGELNIQVSEPVEPPVDVLRPQTQVRIDNAIEIQRQYWEL